MHLVDGRVQYINGVIHSLGISIDTYIEEVDFHVMNLSTTDVILGYPWFYNKNSSLSIDWVHHSITFVLNDCSHFIQCVKKQSLSIVSSPSISKLSCSSLFYCVLDPDIHVYNIDSVSGHLSYFEQQQFDAILNEFRDVFSSELPHGLPPKRNIDHCIDLVPDVAPISVPPYRLSRSEEDEVSKKLKDYL